MKSIYIAPKSRYNSPLSFPASHVPHLATPAPLDSSLLEFVRFINFVLIITSLSYDGYLHSEELNAAGRGD